MNNVPVSPRFQRKIFLRLLRWRIQFRHLPLAKFWFGTILSILVVTPIWRHFGTDVALPVFADATPILLAIVGIVISYIQPKKENHRATTFILIFAGMLGTSILSINRTRSDRAHRAEMDTINKRVEAVGDQNTRLANFLLNAKDNGKISEVDRRKGIETVLRNEYILSHNPIDPEILAGNKMPPNEWMNQKLKEMGEKWTVSEETAGSEPSTATRSYLTFTGNPIFTGPNPTGAEGSNFAPGYRLGFNLHYRASGPNPVQLLHSASALYIKPDYKSETQAAVVTQFIAEVKKEQTSHRVHGQASANLHTMMAGDNEFFTAFGWSDTMQPLIVTQEDLDNFKTGAEVNFVIAEIIYQDGKAIHHLRRCMWLQPPASNPGTWHFCETFNDSD